jgi:GT2 family glycosyltransferase
VLPFVSIVVATFNRKDLLQKLIESLETLCYPRDRFEVIVVDNGSEDGAWELAQEAASRVSFLLRCFRNNDVRVPAASRNLGVLESRGEIIAFTDSDCVVTPSWIDEGVKGLRQGVGIVQGKTLPYPDDPLPPAFRTVKVLAKGYGETCNIFYRREAFLAAGGFEREFYFYSWGEDTDLAYRVSEKGYDWVFCETALVYHRILPHGWESWIKEPWRVFTWAKTVKRHPAIRRDLLWARVFLSRSTAMFDLALLAAVAAWLFHPAFLILVLPFLVQKYLDGGHHLNAFARLARLGPGTFRSGLVFIVLVCGSIRFRSMVL